MKVSILLIALSIFANMAMAEIKNAESVTERNKQLVVDFYTDVLFYGKADAIDKYIGEVYIQHNPRVPNGKEALRKFITGFSDEGRDENPNGKIVRAVAEGDLVVLHVHNYGKSGSQGLAIVDIFRVEGDKIVEHWDVIQKIPEKSKNENTMF